MKFGIFFIGAIFILLAASVSGCTSPEPKDPIIGTWNTSNDLVSIRFTDDGAFYIYGSPGSTEGKWEKIDFGEGRYKLNATVRNGVSITPVIDYIAIEEGSQNVFNSSSSPDMKFYKRI